ncbi:tRNA (adenosine(37)-N6)-threonylcarbamoyltransferase complex transferase subunit TsaD [Helicobacter sp. 12S02232-10]|uniref:tRNA (adenosine(37)-N6)-threonylcarbamoyltransferase complex transferase subunit TsaD n=1 Tax=Helicobacter sp. 12S02232-10 TaxID=1476197 RepID=UPI000BA7303D|nr:tRNA (adenosine(37)-N6)-threonylcarbamoyltransferase complex transferase subunit TsaD [Helicobacter sp. 12S02232-10]PAF49809.1 tRNA (adenosine(37)-N6)-threonylcarbamoyltransferase complex transferase subunit TsaD [Helicobacter sp. 12S02232-10]
MILSIESSCDDSSIALTEIKTAKLLFHSKISQESIHSPYGGVVPEIASRLHAEALPQILTKAKSFLGGSFKNIKAVAVTTQPGLNITLIEGLMMAKALSFFLKIPLISVNHLKGHIYSLFINHPKTSFPLSVLLVSGGHTLIIEAKNASEMSIVAKSMDDSFGESFDKVAKMLSLGYPGGPIVEKYASLCPKNLAFPFPLPLKHSPDLAFSFSGLKNAVRLSILQAQEQGEDVTQESFIAKICAGFQQSACEHLIKNVSKYFQKKQKQNNPVENFCIVGGASANLYLRDKILSLCDSFKCNLLLAPLEFCSDNAAMIGRAALEKYYQKNFADIFTLQAFPKSEENEFQP